MMYPWGHSRRFNSYSEYFKKTFGSRVQKLTINAGFTCPNRDGSKATGGCAYCNNEAFNPSYCQPHKSITQQLDEGVEFHNFRYKKSSQYLAYFQAYSNTYKPLEELKHIFDQAIQYPNVVGLVIGTRPDCIDNQKLEYFARLAEKMYVILEFGIESTNNKTLQFINRQHTVEESFAAIEAAASYGIRTGAHLILGLPGDSRQDNLAMAAQLSALPLDTIKLHQLQITTNTRFARDYVAHPELFNLFELDEYVQFISEFIELLSPQIVIERFAGECPPRYKIAPDWGNIRSDHVLKRIEAHLEAIDSWQGKKYKVLT